MIAIAAVIAQIAVILIHRKRAGGPLRLSGRWRYVPAALAAGAVGWLIIGRPAVHSGDVGLALVYGVVLGAIAATATVSLTRRAWSGWAVAGAAGAAASTWLLDTPVPFS
ncbi:hypothetical protein ACFWXK_23645 [Streptomyces sp. NPDC059070]|uniref:hypothetical protein n=1 Tax=unclassified Streptomyces TaxID=2593676 RepID=UPI0034E19ABE